MWPSMVASKILGNRADNNIYAMNSEDLSETFVESENSNQTSFSPGKSYTVQETFKLFVSSWNIGGITPPDNLSLEDFLGTQNSMADIYVFGFQEIVPLNAGNILGSENSKICTKWSTLIEEALNKRMAIEGRLQNTDIGETPRVHPLKMHNSTYSIASDFQCIISKQMVGIYITIWVRTALRGYISYPSVSSVGCGLLGRLQHYLSFMVKCFTKNLIAPL